MLCTLCCAQSQLTLLQPHKLQPTRDGLAWDLPEKNTGAGCHFLFQGIFPAQDQAHVSLHGQADSLPLYHLESPVVSYTCCLPLPLDLQSQHGPNDYLSIYLFIFLFFLTHLLYYSYHFKESHKLSFKNFIDLFKVLPWSYSVITKSLSLDTYIFCYSVSKSRPALCNPMDCSTPGFPVLHYLPEFAQTHI